MLRPSPGSERPAWINLESRVPLPDSHCRGNRAAAVIAASEPVRAGLGAYSLASASVTLKARSISAFGRAFKEIS